MKARRHPRGSRRQAGVALLMVITAITILALVLVEFSGSTRTHLDQGVNLRDEARASALAETALVLSRACLDPQSWGPMAALQEKVDLQTLCDILLGVIIRGRVDLPVGGLSVELEGIQGVGLARGDVEEVKLTPEESFIGIAGLYCEGGQVQCGTRNQTIKQLRSLLCDPKVAHLFEREQPDGKEYTRAEVIGNLIDWIDPDDSRVYIDPATFIPTGEGAGEGEDSYLKSAGLDYRSKDAPFDSIEELRMVRGISDELFDYLKDKISVHSAGKININSASADVIATLLRANSLLFDALEAGSCGGQSDTAEQWEGYYENYARLVVAAREAKRQNLLLAGKLLAKPYANASSFKTDASDPLNALVGYMGSSPAAALLGAQQVDVNVLLAGYGLNIQLYDAVKAQTNFEGVAQGVRGDNYLYRLQARSRVGDITRRVYAVLKRDGQIVRTMYYRED